MEGATCTVSFQLLATAGAAGFGSASDAVVKLPSSAFDADVLLDPPVKKFEMLLKKPPEPDELATAGAAAAVCTLPELAGAPGDDCGDNAAVEPVAPGAGAADAVAVAGADGEGAKSGTSPIPASW